MAAILPKRKLLPIQKIRKSCRTHSLHICFPIEAQKSASLFSIIETDAIPIKIYSENSLHNILNSTVGVVSKILEDSRTSGLNHHQTSQKFLTVKPCPDSTQRKNSPKVNHQTLKVRILTTRWRSKLLKFTTRWQF